jgi:hypothetical protein
MDVSQHFTTAPPASKVYWLCQLSGWGLFTLSQAVAATQILGLPFGRTVLEIGVLMSLGLVFTHGLRSYVHRHAWARLPLLALVPRILAASFVLSLPLVAIAHYMSIAALWRPDDLDTASLHLPAIAPVLIRVANLTTLFAVWTALYFTITYLRERRSAELRQSELARALQSSELRLLKSQLNPHFLFNSLNCLRALIVEDPAAAQNAVTRLARILRYSLSSGREELVPLERELEIVEDYLALESLRFAERLSIKLNVAPEALGVRVPVMLLQTLVENAIKHGIAELPAGGDVRISAALRGGTLQVDVENTRPEKAANGTQGEGIGLSNAAERLRLLFGTRASLELDLSHSDVAIARIRIPEST